MRKKRRFLIVSGSDINILMPVGLGSGSGTALSDAGRARTEKCGPIRTLVHSHTETLHVYNNMTHI